MNKVSSLAGRRRCLPILGSAVDSCMGLETVTIAADNKLGTFRAERREGGGHVRLRHRAGEAIMMRVPASP